MTGLRIVLKTSEGLEVHLRAGKEMGWPDGARMHWVRLVDGVPAMVTATLALDWNDDCVGHVWISVDRDHSEPWIGNAPSFWALDDALSNALCEWADTFCSEVNKALADVEALTPFADLHWHELAAAHAHMRLDAYVRDKTGFNFSSGAVAPTDAETALALHVEHVILEQAERSSRRRADVEYERAGGVLETEPRAGNEAWKPSVPAEVLEEVERTNGELRAQKRAEGLTPCDRYPLCDCRCLHALA